MIYYFLNFNNFSFKIIAIIINKKNKGEKKGKSK
jgi:hypothetical protein